MSGPTDVDSAGEAHRPLRENEDFRRLLFGRLVTNAGDSLYTVAAMWLVYDLTGSTVYTGLAEALFLLPSALQFLFGPLVDRWPIVRALVAIQILEAVAVLSLPLAMATRTLSVALLLVVIPLLALVNQFVYPAQTAALPRIVASGQLTRANAAFSFTLRGLDMLFEAAGGLLVAVIGVVSLFVLDSVSFVLAALSFAGVRLLATDTDGQHATGVDITGYLSDLADGARAVRGSVFVDMTAATLVVNLGTGVTLAVLPAFADLRAGPALYGAMLGGLGVGRALGAALAPRFESFRFGWLRATTAAGSCLAWLGAAYVPWPALAVGLFALAWVPNGFAGVMANTLEQTVTPADLLGRVASVTASASTLSLPAGALLGGVIGSALGAANTVALGGLALGVASLWYVVRPRLRRLPAMDDIDPNAFDIGIGPSGPEDRSN